MLRNPKNASAVKIARHDGNSTASHHSRSICFSVKLLTALVDLCVILLNCCRRSCDYYNEWDNIKIVYRVANKMFQLQSNHATFSDLELPWRLFRCARLTDGNRLYLCNTAHAFNWHSASRGPSATDTVLAIYSFGDAQNDVICSYPKSDWHLFGYVSYTRWH